MTAHVLFSVIDDVVDVLIFKPIVRAERITVDRRALLDVLCYFTMKRMVLRDHRRDYKYDCYKPYITRSPIHAQKQQARRMALTYYQKALEIDPLNQDLRALSNDVDSEAVKVWSFCAD